MRFTSQRDIASTAAMAFNRIFFFNSTIANVGDNAQVSRLAHKTNAQALYDPVELNFGRVSALLVGDLQDDGLMAVLA